MTKINPTLLDLSTLIETPRLILRPPKIGEGKKLNEAILESFKTLNKFIVRNDLIDLPEMTVTWGNESDS